MSVQFKPNQSNYAGTSYGKQRLNVNLQSVPNFRNNSAGTNVSISKKNIAFGSKGELITKLSNGVLFSALLGIGSVLLMGAGAAGLISSGVCGMAIGLLTKGKK
jgi:hypothetical protein